jgi:YfiH family protein
MPFVYKELGGLGFYEVSGWDGAMGLFTTRKGGVSVPPYDAFNLGAGGGDDQASVKKNRAMLAEALGIKPHALKTINQVHGSDIYTLVSPDSPCPDKGYDAVMTREKGAALCVLTADCVPILIHDPVSGCAAAVHAGWAGSVSRIAGRVVEGMVHAFGARPEDMLAAIGPSIGPCCYEVDEKVMAPLRESFRDWPEMVNPGGNGRFLLDLWETNRNTLLKAGVRPQNISVMGVCTACNEDKFFSHRKSNGKAGRMMGIIMLR